MVRKIVVCARAVKAAKALESGGPKKCRRKAVKRNTNTRLHIDSNCIMGKRKLNEHDIPEDAEAVAASAQATQSTQPSFDTLGLDARLLQGIVRQKFSTPTPVQAKAIPLALEGKDILGTCRLLRFTHSG